MHHVCDPYQTSYTKGKGRKNVQAAGLDKWLDFHEAFPGETIPGFPRLQFAFIDASHLFDLSVLDFVLIDKKLDIGGVVAFHDMWMASLQKLARFILLNRGYRLYAPPGVSPTVPRSGWLRRTFVAGLRHLPAAERIFAQELLMPWSGVPNWQHSYVRKNPRGRTRLAAFRSFLIERDNMPPKRGAFLFWIVLLVR